MATPLFDLDATNGIGQLYELAQGIQNQEISFNESNALTPGFTPVNRMSITYDIEEETVTITATLPIEMTTSAGGVTYTAVDYM